MRPSPSWPLHGKDRLILRIPAFQVSLQMQVALGSLASFPVSLESSPQGGRPCVCPGGKGQDARKGVSKLSLLCPTHHILDSKSEIFLSCEPDSQPLLEERGGRHSQPCPPNFPSSSIHQFCSGLPRMLRSALLCCCLPGPTAAFGGEISPTPIHNPPNPCHLPTPGPPSLLWLPSHFLSPQLQAFLGS